MPAVAVSASSTHGGEDRADHERARAQVDGEEEREDRGRGAVDLREVGGTGEVPAEADLDRLEADRRGGTAEQRGAPARAGCAGGSGRASTKTRNVRRDGHDGAEEDPESERLPARGSRPTFSLTLRATFSSIETITAQRIRPSAPSTSRPLTSLPRTRLRETPPSNTTASVFCIEFITPVAPQSASPSVTRPARLQGDGTDGDQRVEPGRPLRREIELVGDRRRRDPVGRPWSTTAPAARIVATKVARGTSEKRAR